MSMTYWMNEGIGVDSDTIWKHLDMHKCYRLIANWYPEDLPDESEFDLDDYFGGNPFENLGDFLCHIDDSGAMSWGDNGNGVYYFLYTPSYPWNRRENEPKSIQEVHEIIVAAILKVTNLSRDDADRLIDDDIYEMGCG